MEQADNVKLIERAAQMGGIYASEAGRYLENEIGRSNMNAQTIAAFGSMATMGIFGTTYACVRKLGGEKSAKFWLEMALEKMSEGLKNLGVDCSVSILVKEEGGETED